jgi:asparagine synthase (glutamine-hydrolysing)
VAEQWNAPGCADDVARMIRFYLSYYMAGHILAKVDTASMARSLEVRTPFLDTEVAEFACGLPSRFKLRGTARKWLLRRMLRRRLAPEILDRPKKGFGIPLAKWLRGGLRPLAEELLSERALREGGVFRPQAVRALWDEHQRGARDNRKELWTLLCFQHWQRRTGAAPGGEG